MMVDPITGIMALVFVTGTTVEGVMYNDPKKEPQVHYSPDPDYYILEKKPSPEPDKCYKKHPA